MVESFARNTRELLEIEIVLPGRALGVARTLCDRGSSGVRDSYVQLVNASEEFVNIERKCVSEACQTHLAPREASAQTHFSYLKNAWTQYVYEDILGEEFVKENAEEEEEQVNGESEQNEDERSKEKNGGDEETEGPREQTPLELFLEARIEEVIDVIKYNAAVNLYIDDIESLCRKGSGSEIVMKDPTFREQLSLADFSLTNNRAVCDVSLSPNSTKHIIACYSNVPVLAPPETNLINQREFQCKALLWKLDDSLRPQVQLQDHREICCVSFSPHDENVVIGGCSTGHVIVWIIKDYWSNDNGIKNTKLETSRGNDVPIVRAIMVSDKRRSHQLPVRGIRWMTAKYRILSSGKLKKSSQAPCAAQFLTVSEDGTVAVWNLPSFSNSGVDDKVPRDKDDAFRPIFRLRIRSGEESGNFTLLCLCLPSLSILEERGDNQQGKRQLSSEQKDYMKSLWIGCVEGFLKCTWEEQVLDEEASEVDCKVLCRSCVHDGPVTQIERSPYLQDVLLTIGGRVFAIWKDDYLDSALFWRRMTCRYTACCWASEPGVFVLGTQEGELELWDIRNDTSWPVFSQTVSSNPITRLFLLQYQAKRQYIGVGDDSGFFRAFREPEMFGSEDSVRRMDWFEEYVWREVRRKKVFSGWQSDFLANDSLVAAKRAARRDEQRNREAEEAREKLRREREEISRLKAEKRARSAPIPKHEAWRAKEYERMKSVLLKKKHLNPVELEAKRLPLVALKAERDAKLKKADENVSRGETYFSNTLAIKFPELHKLKEDELKVESIKLEKSVDDYLREFYELRDRTRKKLNSAKGVKKNM